MSIQSDIEFLTIQAVEHYASNHQISSNVVKEIFYKHNIFEKMIIQHEYLHQIPFDEVMEYIDSLIQSHDTQLSLFHGTIHKFDEIDLSKSHNRRDFGTGFYTTVLEQQAIDWAYRLSLRKKTQEYYVYHYTFEERSDLNIKRFTSLDEEWLEFIKQNRHKGGCLHNYDVVIGPVADDNTMETVQLYIAGILSAKESVERLRYNKVNNQVSFHTKKALETLKYIRRRKYE